MGKAFRRRANRQHHINATDSAYNGQLALLWSLRVLYRLKGYKGIWGYPKRITSDGAILNAVGLGKLEDEEIKIGEFKQLLKDKLDETECLQLTISNNLTENLDKLGDIIQLSTVDKQLLALTIILHSHKGLQDTAEALGLLPVDAVHNVLSVILDIPEKSVIDALSKISVLFCTGLLRVDRSQVCCLKDKLILQNGFVDTMRESHANIMSLLEHYFLPAKAGSLTPIDFEYLGIQYIILQKLIRNARDQALKGVNILFYGPPGTGKTELARLIARQTGRQNYEISCINVENHSSLRQKEQDRFMSYQLSQSVLEYQNRAMIIFDEVEDVFTGTERISSGWAISGGSQKGKTNTILEENVVPTIWITNSLRNIDKAYLRRFSFTLKLDVPPKAVRERMLLKQFKETDISDAWLQNISIDRRITPAMISSAAGVVSAIGQLEEAKSEQVLEQILTNSLQVLGYEAQIQKKASSLFSYDINALNPDHELAPILAGLNQESALRLCLYGPPGTGKTAFGHYIAEQNNSSLITKRASDLLDPYIGKTEKNIASMFQEAASENVILMLDEADSFLRDRRGAVRNWEVTQVNELLTQMESYEGIFICSTNLMDNLDEASIRRFDFKIKLDYLMPEQAWLLFQQVFKEHSLINCGEVIHYRKRLNTLSNLTPGDFAVALRQHQLLASELTPDWLFTVLRNESRFKQQKTQNNGIGFMATL